METKQTYLLNKDGVAMAFEGTERPTIERSVSYSSKVEWGQYDYEIETAKASALPVVNSDSHDVRKAINYALNISHGEGSEQDVEDSQSWVKAAMKEGEVVPLEGWKLDKVYQYKPDKNSLWWTDCHVSVWQDRTRHSNEPELAREAYRLVRSEPEQKGETDHFYKESHEPSYGQKKKALMSKARWVADCIKNGWPKEQIPDLEKVWDKFRDESGELRKTPAAPVESQEELWNEMEKYFVQQSIIRRGVKEIFADFRNEFTITRNITDLESLLEEKGK